MAFPPRQLAVASAETYIHIKVELSATSPHHQLVQRVVRGRCSVQWAFLTSRPSTSLVPCLFACRCPK